MRGSFPTAVPKLPSPSLIHRNPLVSGGHVVASASAPVTLHDKERAREILITLRQATERWSESCSLPIVIPISRGNVAKA